MPSVNTDVEFAVPKTVRKVRRKSTRTATTEPALRTSTRTKRTPSNSSCKDSSDADSDVEVKQKTRSLLSSPRKIKNPHGDDSECPVTPPKQKKKDNIENIPSPTTPSSLLKKLSIHSPHKCNNDENDKCCSKSLFGNDNFTGNSYVNARKALHSTLPSEMPGREKELTELRNFIKDHLEAESSGTLYVSGPPGTGKTASLSKILQEPDIESQFRQVYVNCTGIKSSNAIFSRIVKELGIKANGKSEKDNLSAIETYLSKKHKMILLVLDELDQLESKKQSVLYTIFEWPSKPNSKLILVGIANALDLTDRILPRLQARCELKPKLMHFAPYSKQQIIEIFTDRLKQAGVLDVFSPVAIQMLAAKVSAVSGDVRRALDIGRRVVELVEQNRKQDVLRSIDNISSLESKLVDESPVPVVDLKQVVNILNNVYGTTQTLAGDDCEETFPLQQKIVICSLLLILKKARNKDVTIGKLHEVYRKVCVKQNLLAVDQAEFVGICSLIETKGIIRVTGKKEPRLYKVHLEWDENEVSASLRDKQLMSSILQDETCIGKL